MGSKATDSKMIDRYLELVNVMPKWFRKDGNIRIELNEDIIRSYSIEKGVQLGVVYESDYNIVLVDLVYQQPGQYWRYERLIKKSKGSGVVIMPKYEEKYILLRQYRHALQGEQYAFPRGFGEDSLSCLDNVRKEVKEEIGSEVLHTQYLGEIVADSGLCGDRVKIYAAEVTKPIKEVYEEGILELLYLTKEKIKEMIAMGEIIDSFTISAYLYSEL